MNILFLYESIIDPNKGGVQRVTKVLADYFETKGNSVYFISLYNYSENDYRDKRQFIVPENKIFTTPMNIKYFTTFIKDNSIDVVINQGGLSKDCSRLANYSNEFGALEVSVLHNSPLAKIINFSSSMKGRIKKLDFLLPLTDIKWIKNILLWIYKLKNQSHFKKLCRYNNKIVLLSNNFRDEFNFFVGKDYFHNKIAAISNPSSFEINNNTIQFEKDKILLFVGRVAFSQKRVDLLIHIWNILYERFPNWKLLIVGDGPDLENAKSIVKDFKIKRVYFEGFQNPEPYYEKASIFCMTSSFEGLPMVLVEAQSYGTIPVAFYSFASVYDIIENGQTGFLIEPFDEETFADVLSNLMNDEEERLSISQNCIESAKKFSIENIGNQWLELFYSIMNENDSK